MHKNIRSRDRSHDYDDDDNNVYIGTSRDGGGGDTISRARRSRAAGRHCRGRGVSRGHTVLADYADMSGRRR